MINELSMNAIEADLRFNLYVSFHYLSHWLAVYCTRAINNNQVDRIYSKCPPLPTQTYARNWAGTFGCWTITIFPSPPPFTIGRRIGCNKTIISIPIESIYNHKWPTFLPIPIRRYMSRQICGLTTRHLPMPVSSYTNLGIIVLSHHTHIVANGQVNLWSYNSSSSHLFLDFQYCHETCLSTAHSFLSPAHLSCLVSKPRPLRPPSQAPPTSTAAAGCAVRPSRRWARGRGRVSRSPRTWPSSRPPRSRPRPGTAPVIIDLKFHPIQWFCYQTFF